MTEFARCQNSRRLQSAPRCNGVRGVRRKTSSHPPVKARLARADDEHPGAQAVADAPSDPRGEPCRAPLGRDDRRLARRLASHLRAGGLLPHARPGTGLRPAGSGRFARGHGRTGLFRPWLLPDRRARRLAHRLLRRNGRLRNRRHQLASARSAAPCAISRRALGLDARASRHAATADPPGRRHLADLGPSGAHGGRDDARGRGHGRCLDARPAPQRAPRHLPHLRDRAHGFRASGARRRRRAPSAARLAHGALRFCGLLCRSQPLAVARERADRLPRRWPRGHADPRHLVQAHARERLKSGQSSFSKRYSRECETSPRSRSSPVRR